MIMNQATPTVPAHHQRLWRTNLMGMLFDGDSPYYSNMFQATLEVLQRRGKMIDLNALKLAKAVATLASETEHYDEGRGEVGIVPSHDELITTVLLRNDEISETPEVLARARIILKFSSEAFAHLTPGN